MKQMTQQMEMHTMVRFAAACSLALTLGFAPTAMAQQTATGSHASAALAQQPAANQAVAKPPVSEEKEEAAEPQKPGQEGLKVHGHWKIVSKNPDGTVAKTYEFENSLVVGGGGDLLLALLLTNQGAIGEMYIRLGGYPGSLCAYSCALLPSVSASDPVVASTACAAGAYACFGGETISFQRTPSPGGLGSAAIVLSGSFTAPTAGNIAYVTTSAYVCSSINPFPAVTAPSTAAPVIANITAASCLAGSGSIAQSYYADFTGTQLMNNFVFAAGQLVQVTVTISFS